MLSHLDEHEDGIRLVEVVQLVRQGRDLFNRLVHRGMGDDHRMTLKLIGQDVVGQLLIEGALLCGQRMMEKAMHDPLIGAMFQQPRGSAQVARGRRLVVEPAGIFVDAQQ